MKTLSAPPSAAYEFGDFRLELGERRLVRRDGSVVPLTPRVFATLRYLVEHSGRVLDKETLMKAVWPDCMVEENNLVQNISTLRRAFGDSAGVQRYIVTVPGHGYRFVPDVQTVDEGPDAPAAAPDSAVVPVPNAAVDLPSSRSQRRVGLYAVVAVLVLVAVTVLVWRQTHPSLRPPTVSSAGDKSIAVLPFANLSNDPANAYFAEGVRDEILARLSKVAALKVISRTSTQNFQNSPKNVRDIAEQLGVGNILEGSVQRSGDSVRVTVQLIHASSDAHVWADTYDRKLTDMFQVETEIAQRVASSLAATLNGSETRALESQPTANVEAHHAYLKGRYFWNKRTNEGFRQAIEQFNRAIELDPSYAVAYAGLADAVLFLGGDSPASQTAAVVKGRAALQKAIALDESLGEAHASLGLLAMNHDWDWSTAEREFKRAIELNPGYATAHQWNGEFLTEMGRPEEGIAELKRARDLDPLSLIINTDLAKVYMLARRYDEAITQFNSALEMDPDFEVAHGLLALTYSLTGMHQEAAAQIRKIKDLENEPMRVTWLGCVGALAGQPEAVEHAANRLQELSAQTYVPPVWQMVLYAAAGDREQMFKWADKVIEEHAVAGAIPLKVNPIFDRVRSDPRYDDLLRRAHFTP